MDLSCQFLFGVGDSFIVFIPLIEFIDEELILVWFFSWFFRQVGYLHLLKRLQGGFVEVKGFEPYVRLLWKLNAFVWVWILDYFLVGLFLLRVFYSDYFNIVFIWIKLRVAFLIKVKLRKSVHPWVTSGQKRVVFFAALHGFEIEHQRRPSLVVDERPTADVHREAAVD